MNEYVLGFLYGDLTLRGRHLSFWVEYGNFVLHRQSIFQFSFTFLLILKRIPRTS